MRYNNNDFHDVFWIVVLTIVITAILLKSAYMGSHPKQPPIGYDIIEETEDE